MSYRIWTNRNRPDFQLHRCEPALACGIGEIVSVCVGNSHHCELRGSKMTFEAKTCQRQLGSRYKRAAVAIFWLLLFLVRTPHSAVAQSTDPSVVGQWTAPQDWSFEAVHMHLLPTGKVLFWPGFNLGDNARIWDPATNNVTTAAFADFNIFCSGHTLLPNGQLLVAGRHNNP